MFGPYPVTLAPTVGALVLVYGLVPLIPSAISTWLGLVALLGTVVGLVAYVVEPAWVGPRWYRTRPRVFDLTVPTNAAVAAAIRPPAEQDSELNARRARTGQPVLTRRRVRLVGPEWGQPSALHTEGAVGGHLLFFPAEIVFAADRSDDAIRGGPTVRHLPMASITSVRPGAARGQVVVETSETTWLVTSARPRRLLGDLTRHRDPRA